MRGQGTNAQAALLRIDGAGKIDVVAFADVKFSKVDLPNAPAANPDDRAQLAHPVDHRHGVRGRQALCGRPLERRVLVEAALGAAIRSTRSTAAPASRSYHGNHGQFETRSPVYTFVPYKVKGETNLIAGYLCTPLVKFPVTGLRPGGKVMGTTIAELGNRNRPLDMIVYKKDGKEFLLMSNNSRGVMKIPTDGFADAPKASPSRSADKAGVGYETITAMKGVEQLDLLDAHQHHRARAHRRRRPQPRRRRFTVSRFRSCDCE